MVNSPWRAAAAAVLLALSCADGVTEPLPPVPTEISANSSTSLTAVAGAAVTELPSVIVRDQRGDPMGGVAVTFAVTSGGGSATGESAVTNSSGVATVGGWTLGTTAGTNTLTAAADNLPAVTFVATGTAGAAASVVKKAGDEQTAIAGSAVPVAPSVTVQDANGNPVSGVRVDFDPANDGSSVTGRSQITDASGTATVGAWTLGTVVGTKVLAASVTGLPAASFVASAIAGPPASLEKWPQSDNQIAAVGTAVAVPPAVIVRDTYGNPVSGVTVVFAVESGGGAISGAVAPSNGTGFATASSWTLGNLGSNTATATVSGIPPVTLLATAVHPCDYSGTHVAGTSTNGQLTTLDCQLSTGAYVDFYTVPCVFRHPSRGCENLFLVAVQFRQTSAFDSYLLLFNSSGSKIAENDNDGTSKNSSIKAILQSGNSYRLGASTFAPNVTGDYSLTSVLQGSTDVTGCEKVFVADTIQINQNLTTSDCSSSSVDPFYYDEFHIYASSVGLFMTSGAFSTRLHLYDAAGKLLASSTISSDPGIRESQLVFRPAILVPAHYVIRASSTSPGLTGQYRLNIAAPIPSAPVSP